ncbi:MAG: DUF4388 domain-containing protein [Ktedonobacteraceae bacterium]|nr:DUF4388 domain-containing protein [Ktedonobacteraceae bacterium]
MEQQQDRIKDPIMGGDLQTLGLQSILKMLALSGKTGALLVTSGPETLSISLRKGQIVGLRLQEEGVGQPDLLGMLCLINKLDAQRAQLIREQAHRDMQLALAMLVERGWMSMQEMQRRLEFAITQSLSHAMRWLNGRFAFHRQLVPMESKMQPLDVDSVLLEALRQADEWEEFLAEGAAQLTRTTIARWQPEVSKDVANLGLQRESIEVLCLCNGEVSLQAISLILMMPEARVARIMMKLLELRLIEVVDTALETELQRDLHNIIIKCQHSLAQNQPTSPEQHLLDLLKTLSECINYLLIHHGKYARSLRGRGQTSPMEKARYLENRFEHRLQALAREKYPILETVSFSYGMLDYNDISTLNKVVKGDQLEEFYWEAVQGLVAFLRILFTDLLRDEVGTSSTGRQLNAAWKVFLSEIDHKVQQYQFYRAHRAAQKARNRESQKSSLQLAQNWDTAPGSGGDFWSPETQRRLI